jgi:hypothetical protein
MKSLGRLAGKSIGTWEKNSWIRPVRKNFGGYAALPVTRIMALHQTIGNQAVQRLFAGTRGLQGSTGGLQHDDTRVIMNFHAGSKGAPPTGDEKGDCSGRIKDQESLSIKAAKHYVATRLVWSPGDPETVSCDPPISTGAYLCRVTFTDGTMIKVIARPDAIIVGVNPLSLSPPPDRPLCFYDFHCTPSGELVLTERECKTGKQSSP